MVIPLRSRRKGQILIPALFMLPCLFLFVFLIFETAKLSREKIRRQFAVDSAAFVEMTNYSEFLSRSAYVNGAFPHRIFKEGFAPGTKDSKTGQSNDTTFRRADGKGEERLYDMLRANGAFPYTEQSEPLDPYPTWLIQYRGPAADDKNKAEPDFPQKLELLTLRDATETYLSWPDAQQIYELYVKIYTLLGSVEDAQYSVFKRLTSDHNFFRKSYWLNTGDNVDAGREGAQGFRYSFNPKPHCVQEMVIHGRKLTGDAFQPSKPFVSDPPVRMNSTIQGCSPPGLFQVMTVRDAELKNLNIPHDLAGYPGYPIVQHWNAPSNYFRVDFNRLQQDPVCGTDNGQPCVHATIALRGGHIWPNPTPKFQTKLYP